MVYDKSLLHKCLYAAWAVLFRPIYKLWIGKVDGLENIPKNQAFIIAANHASYFDTVLPHSLIIPITNKKIHAFVNSRYWGNPITDTILDGSECIKVYVGENAKGNRESLEKALGYLKKGEIVLIFPEGTRSPDGKLRKAYSGIARLALKSQVPVVPFGIINSHKVLPKGAIFPRFKRCGVKIGKPIYFDKYYNKKINDKNLEEITRKIMQEIAKFIDQKYTHN